jgi:hypothetical protein
MRRKTARPRKTAAARRPSRRPKRTPGKQTRRGKVRSSKAGRRTKPARPAKRRTAAPVPARPSRGASSKPRTAERPALDRERRTLSEDERLDLGRTAGVEGDRMMSAARSGHDDLRQELGRHTETGPELTAGDIDAKWQDAYAVGDEAPGGDNPTPDQDRVDDIGRALGIEYKDDQELMGGDEVAERDKHRWELDPASSDDWPHEK